MNGVWLYSQVVALRCPFSTYLVLVLDWCWQLVTLNGYQHKCRLYKQKYIFTSALMGLNSTPLERQSLTLYRGKCSTTTKSKVSPPGGSITLPPSNRQRASQQAWLTDLFTHKYQQADPKWNNMWPERQQSSPYDLKMWAYIFKDEANAGDFSDHLTYCTSRQTATPWRFLRQQWLNI